LLPLSSRAIALEAIALENESAKKTRSRFEHDEPVALPEKATKGGRSVNFVNFGAVWIAPDAPAAPHA